MSRSAGAWPSGSRWMSGGEAEQEGGFWRVVLRDTGTWSGTRAILCGMFLWIP